MRVKDRLGIIGELEVIKIDRNSRKVIEERKAENFLTAEGADFILRVAYYMDEFACGGCGTYYKPNKLVLLDDGQYVIKQIPDGATTDVDCDNTKCTVTISWSDTTSDSYTAHYAGLGYATYEYNDYNRVDISFTNGAVFSPPLTKSPNDQIVFMWHINAPIRWLQDIVGQ